MDPPKQNSFIIISMLKRLTEILEKEGLAKFKRLCYQITREFDYACVLDSCQLDSGVYKGKYEFLIGLGAERLINSYNETSIDELKGEWCFGVFSYELKNKLENLHSKNKAFIQQDELALFVPKIVLAIDKNGKIHLHKGELCLKEDSLELGKTNQLKKLNHIRQEDYIARIHQIKELIKEGDVYELNYCIQHQYSFGSFDPLNFQLSLLQHSPVPMASFLKWQERAICSASMERFLAKNGDELCSQPIKGTIKKGLSEKEDQELIHALYHSEKDRAENVMIVDLVRNDLARICKSGTIKVEELFGIYSYLQLHQMISTVKGRAKYKGMSKLLKATFPMGSMTGAPKVAAMKHIDRLEDFQRGWYSGSVGYIEPNGNFDLNVMIRGLISDQSTKRICYSAGGAITIDSIAEGEWLEILLKTKAIEEMLGSRPAS